MSVPATRPMDAEGRGVKRVLVYRLGSLGDTIVALPCLHQIAAAFPTAERRMLTNFPVASKAPAAAAVLGASGLIGSYERYSVGTRNPLELLGLAWRIRRWRPDVLVYLTAARGVANAARDARFFRMCGVRRIVGLPDTEDLQRPRSLPDGMREAEASRLARTLASTLGTPPIDDPASWDLRLSAEERASAETLLQPVAGRNYFVVSLGTKAQANQWGVENWNALLGELASLYPQHALVMIGAGEEHAQCEEAATEWKARSTGSVLNLCGQGSPRVSAAVCSGAALFLGHDSGPLHLAACAGAPCVGIYSARNQPGIWFPHGARNEVLYHRVDCMGCGLTTCIEQRKKCILSITVEEVITRVQRLLPSAA